MQLKIDEFSGCLGTPASTIERWIRQGRIPVKKIGEKCIFSEKALKKWAETHNLHYHSPGEKQAEKKTEKFETLSGAIRQGGIYYNVSGNTVEEVLKSAVSAMINLDSETDRRALYESLIAREHMMSTGIGSGVAIPHPRTPLGRPGIPTQIATCFLKQPVDFKAVDKKPVGVLFVLAAGTSRLHLHLLSRISYCLRDNAFLQLLSETPDRQTIEGKFAEFDTLLNGSG